MGPHDVWFRTVSGVMIFSLAGVGFGEALHGQREEWHVEPAQYTMMPSSPIAVAATTSIEGTRLVYARAL